MFEKVEKETIMNNLQVLDCTLRDGAQVNEARFGEEAIRNIIEKFDAG